VGFKSNQRLKSAGTGRNGVPLPVSGVPPPEIAVPPPKVVTPPGIAVPSSSSISGREWRCATVRALNCIFGKIITIVATRGQILRPKCTKFYFGWGYAPDPAGGAYRRGLLLRVGRGGKGRGGNVEFHHLLLSNLTTESNTAS